MYQLVLYNSIQASINQDQLLYFLSYHIFSQKLFVAVFEVDVLKRKERELGKFAPGDEVE